MAQARRIARAIAAAFAPDGLRLLQNNGIAAEQTVPHYHLHILPCRRGDTARPAPPNERGPRIPFAERLRIAEQIRTHLES